MHDSMNIVIEVRFDSNMAWCTGNHVAARFYCNDQPDAEIVERSKIVIDNKNVRFYVADLLLELMQGAAIKQKRTCGLIINDAVLCDQDGHPFQGLQSQDYEFMLRDNVAPTEYIFEPPNTGSGIVPLDGSAVIGFDEPVILGGADAILTRFDYDTAGDSIITQIIPLESPDAAVEKTLLRVNLAGRMEPGILYSLSLQAGAVLDLSGNPYKGLAKGAYIFRAGTEPVKIGSNSGDETTAGAIIFILMLSGIFLLTVTLALALRFFHTTVRRADERMVAPVRSQPPIATSFYKVSAAQATGDSHASGVYPPYARPGQSLREAASAVQGNYSSSRVPPAAPAAAGEDKVEAGPTKIDVEAPGEPSLNQSNSNYSSSPQHSTQQSNASTSFRARGTAAGTPFTGVARDGWTSGAAAGPKSAARGPAPSVGQFGDRSRQSGRGSTSGAANTKGSSATANEQKSNSGGGGPTSAGARANSKGSSTDEGLEPEVVAVKARLQSAMDEPVAIRKKLLKDLMLSYHPDKNSSTTAKTVFQYINNSKAWFLHDV
jgi:hypothetical protein